MGLICYCLLLVNIVVLLHFIGLFVTKTNFMRCKIRNNEQLLSKKNDFMIKQFDMHLRFPTLI